MAITPNMNLTLPVASATAGPEYATQNTTAFEAIDLHDHTPGKGVLIPVSALNINADLNLGSNRVLNAEIIQGVSQASAITGSTAINSFQVVNGEAWYVDALGQAVQLTSGGSIVAPAVSGLPAGAMMAYAGLSAPSGWLVANGTAVSRATYAVLFAAIGTTYGIGDGSTTFTLPNKQGRTSIGAGTYTDPVTGAVSRTQGARAGAEKHVLTTAELATHTHIQDAHTHTQNAHNHTGTVAVNGGAFGTVGVIGSSTSAGTAANVVTVNSNTATNQNTTATNQNTGSDTAHNNMQPYEVDLWIIKT